MKYFVVGLRCLYVEDEDYNRKIVKEMMERSRLTVFTAENGLQGLNMFKVSCYSLIIKQIYMIYFRIIRINILI